MSVRFEISTTGVRLRTNLSEAAAFGFDPLQLSLSLYYPFLNMTTTRTCFLGAKDIPDHEAIAGLVCGRECEICAFEMAHHRINEKLIIKGNTVFLSFPNKFYASETELLAMRVDRLVYCPVP